MHYFMHSLYHRVNYLSESVMLSFDVTIFMYLNKKLTRWCHQTFSALLGGDLRCHHAHYDITVMNWARSNAFKYLPCNSNSISATLLFICEARQYRTFLETVCSLWKRSFRNNIFHFPSLCAFLFCHISWYWSVWMLEFNLRGSKLWGLPVEGGLFHKKFHLMKYSFDENLHVVSLICGWSIQSFVHALTPSLQFVVIYFFEIKLWINFVVSQILQINLKRLWEIVLKARKNVVCLLSENWNVCQYKNRNLSCVW